MSQKKRNIFNISDDEDEDDIFISSVKPLPSNAVERSDLSATEFDPDTFLSSKRHLGLERMKTELNVHLKSLKTELVELINRDYQDFINLSTNLKGIDKEIEYLKQPLNTMEVQVQDVRNHFQEVIDTLEGQLEARAQLRDKKATLKLLLNIHDSVSKVENLLEINADIKPNSIMTSSSDTVINESLGKQIERVAIEYNQMQYLVRRGKHLAFVTENEWRIARIKDTLEQKLYKALSTAISQVRLGEVTRSTKQSLTECLRTYALIDQTAIAEKIVREEFIRPYLTKIITSKAVEGARNYDSPNGSDESKHPLSIMYAKVLDFASTDLQPILDITQKALKGSNYDILVNSLWLEVTGKIDKECKSIFAAGQTDVFHKNYSATVSFISGIEKLCYSKRSLLYLRNHPTYTDFLKRWQLLVYFQLRFREIVKDVEDVLEEDVSLYNLDFDQEIILPNTKAVSKAIKQCWSDRIFLYGLSHRFWKLTLQLIVRYNGWAGEVASDSFDYKSKFNIKEYVKFLAILSHDVDHLVNSIETDKTEEMIPRLPSNVQDLPSLKESMNAVLDPLHNSTRDKINSSITKIISAECTEVLKLVKSITSQYRQTNKQAPTEPSYFIPNIFKPFQRFIEQNQTWIDSQHQLDWAQRTGVKVTQEYTTIVNDLLTSMTKTEDSLNKLKTKKETVSSSHEMTDQDKIRLQLYLDVEEFGKELDNLKIDKSTTDYLTLFNVVKPFKKMGKK